MAAGALLTRPLAAALRHTCSPLPLRPRAGSRGVAAGARARRCVPAASCRQTEPGRPEQPVRRAAEGGTPVTVAERPVAPWRRVVEHLAKGLAVGALALALTLSAADPALAARSGGRVGGSNFSSGRSYSQSSGLSSGLGSSGRGSSISPGFSAPTPRLGGPGTSYSFGWGLAPFGGYGYGYGAPLSRTGGGGSFTDVLVFGLFAVIAFTVISSFINRGGSDSDYDGERVAVAKVQVGLLGSARSLQRQLDRLASRADTTTPSGLHYVLQETVLALLRHPEYAVYGASDVSKSRSLEGGENKFNRLSMEERGKFKEETLVNVGGRSRSQTLSRGGGDGIQELIVITLLVAVAGDLKIPKIASRDELVQALNRLGAIRSEQVMAVEVLWTPQDENDSYTKDDLFFDYPSLNTL